MCLTFTYAQDIGIHAACYEYNSVITLFFVILSHDLYSKYIRAGNTLQKLRQGTSYTKLMILHTYTNFAISGPTALSPHPTLARTQQPLPPNGPQHGLNCAVLSTLQLPPLAATLLWPPSGSKGSVVACNGASWLQSPLPSARLRGGRYGRNYYLTSA